MEVYVYENSSTASRIDIIYCVEAPLIGDFVRYWLKDSSTYADGKVILRALHEDHIKILVERKDITFGW